MVLYYILVPLAWLVWHIGFRIRGEGRENLKKVQTKGCILAPTHVSAIDPVFIVVTRWGRRMIVFAKKELFEINALLTWFFRSHGATQNFFARIAPFGSQCHRRDHSVARSDRGIYRNRRASAKQRGIFID